VATPGLLARALRLTAGFLAVGWAVSGCAAGGSSTKQTPVVAPTASAAAAPQAKLGQASITITIPQSAASSVSARKAAFISASAQSLAISSYAVSAGVPVGPALATSNQNLVSTAPGCTGSGPIQCTVTVAAPIGQAAFSVAIYQGLNETGATLSSLPQSAATVFTIAEGRTNVVLPLILNGVPSSIVVALTQSSVNGGVSASIPVSIVAEDAGGNIIVGPGSYANPITLTDSDGTGTTMLSTTTIAGPGQAVTLAYNGGHFTSPISISASASGASDTPSSLSEIRTSAARSISSPTGIRVVTRAFITAAT
jgi:hypothetical protein